MDDNAHVHNTVYRRTVTRSNRRFTYEEAQEIIEGADGDFRDEILPPRPTGKNTAQRTLRQRFRRIRPLRVRFEIDEKGHPVSVFFKESKDANKLIEEFMLLAKQDSRRGNRHSPSKEKRKGFRLSRPRHPRPRQAGKSCSARPDIRLQA